MLNSVCTQTLKDVNEVAAGFFILNGVAAGTKGNTPSHRR